MRASFNKFDDQWRIRVVDELPPRDFAGQELEVPRRNGTTAHVQLGERIAQWAGGTTRIYAIDQQDWKRANERRPV